MSYAYEVQKQQRLDREHRRQCWTMCRRWTQLAERIQAEGAKPERVREALQQAHEHKLMAWGWNPAAGFPRLR